MKKSIIFIFAIFLSFLLFAQEEAQSEEAAPQQAEQDIQAQPAARAVPMRGINMPSRVMHNKKGSANSVFTGSKENESLVKLEIEYKLLDNTPQKKIEYAAIVSNNVVEGTPEYKTIAEHHDESTIGNYLMITGLEAVLPNQKEQNDAKLAAVDLDSFDPAKQDYKITATFPNGERKEYKHSDLLLADNGVAFINFKEDPELFPVMLNGESARDVTLNRTLYIKNFGKTYEVTPLFINFSLRSSGTMEYYLQKNRSFIARFFNTTAVAHITIGNLIMMLVAFIFIFLAIAKDYEPLLLLPIGFGILIGNIPTAAGVQIGVYDPGSVLNYLYFGVLKGIYPPLIFLGIGAMTTSPT